MNRFASFEMPTALRPLGPASHWFLVHTRPRQEGFALRNLERRGFECYLPMQSTGIEGRPASTVDSRGMPLFPRYLFARPRAGGDADAVEQLRWTPGVSRVLARGTQPSRIDAALIDALRAAEAGLCGGAPDASVVPAVVRLCRTAGEQERVLALIEFLSQPPADEPAPSRRTLEA